jgi:hypothetical protein
VFCFALCPLAIIAQRVGNPSGVPMARTSLQRLSGAITNAAQYLERNCDPSGRFAYLVDTDSGQTSPSYNIVRHAGAIYAIAMFDRLHPDWNAANAMVRAANFISVREARPDLDAAYVPQHFALQWMNTTVRCSLLAILASIVWIVRYILRRLKTRTM